jgi:hypothetical protein
MIGRDYIHGNPLEIDSGPQFLGDDYLVEDRWNLQRRVGKITKYGGNPVICNTQPWERGASAAVLHDPETGTYRAWYNCFSLSGYFDPQRPSYYVCYAESADGFHWEKPLSEDRPFGEWSRSNVVYAGRTGINGHAQQVLLNPDESDADRRFLMVTNKVDLAYSPDGLVWTPAEQTLIDAGSDTANHLVWVEEEGLWYLYMRPPVRTARRNTLPEGRRHVGRRMAVSVSPDLLEWGPARTLMYADERDDFDIDSVRVFRRHGMFYCLYDNMHQQTGQSEKELYLATSRDGINWERAWDRAVFVPRGEPGQWDAGQVHAPRHDPIVFGDNLLFYYGGSASGQADWDREECCGTFRLRRDRFVGQHAGETHGILLTRQFILNADRLELNCSVIPKPYAAPEIRVEILECPNPGGPEQVLPGYSMDDCDPVRVDRLDAPVSWKGSSDLRGLHGKPVYLRFRLLHAALYGFRIASGEGDSAP